MLFGVTIPDCSGFAWFDVLLSLVDQAGWLCNPGALDFELLQNARTARLQWHVPSLVLPLEGQEQRIYLCEFWASPVYREGLSYIVRLWKEKKLRHSPPGPARLISLFKCVLLGDFISLWVYSWVSVINFRKSSGLKFQIFSFLSFCIFIACYSLFVIIPRFLGRLYIFMVLLSSSQGWGYQACITMPRLFSEMLSHPFHPGL